MEHKDEHEMMASATSQHYEKFQRLTFILERKGVLTSDELAEVYGEQDTPSTK